jgi:hypothetical protein
MPAGVLFISCDALSSTFPFYQWSVTHHDYLTSCIRID